MASLRVNRTIDWDHSWILAQLEIFENAYFGQFSEIAVVDVHNELKLRILAESTEGQEFQCWWDPHRQEPRAVVWELPKEVWSVPFG